jgi:hypothetical protein
MSEEIVTPAPEPQNLNSTPAPAPVVTPTATTPDKTGGKTYSEQEVENMIKERLEREKTQREKAVKAAQEKAEAEAAAKNGEWEKVAKANADKAAQLEAQLKARELNDLKRTIAERVGIPLALAARLIGDTEKDLEADAKALLETLPKPTPAQPAKAPQPGSFVQPNPGNNGQQGETLAQQRARIHGAPVDAFDPRAAAQHGGGASYTDRGRD